MARTPRSIQELTHSLWPFGLGHTKPHHYSEMFRILWDNKDNLGYAWKVLSQGVCDGCALGTSGLKDWTIDGTHLCLVRLNLLRLNTMPAFEPWRTADAAPLKAMSSRDLREMGRIGYPLRRRKGEPGFTRVTFKEVWEDVGPRWRAFDPARTSMFVTSRGVTNEVYFTAQKVMRFLGSNSVDNSARLCHAPSTAAMKSTIGVAASTCSYKDWFDADVIVFFGSNPANDQPVAMKYLYEAKRRGTRVLMVNAYREPGMTRYWIPSNADSALFGTNISDRTVLVKVGGDLAFLNAVQKVMIAKGWHKTEFINAATTGFDALKAGLEVQSMTTLLAECGVALPEVEAFAQEIGEANKGIFVWSMGLTQHAHGTDTVRALVNLGLMREFVGRPGTGLVPIRGHSGVQGGAEMGAYSTVLPGGVPITPESARRFSELWGFNIPPAPGKTTVQAFDAAHRGELDGFYCIGGNFLETMPQPQHIAESLARIPLRIHTDIVMTSQMLVDPADTVYVLPSRTRYEQPGGGTETTTERRVVFSPYISGHDIAETRGEWEMLLDFAKAVKPEAYEKIHFADGAAIRHGIEAANPVYRGIAALEKQGDQFQWGGPHLCAERRFATADGKAHFIPVVPPRVRGDRPPLGAFRLATRRGKQFNSMVQKDYDALTGAERDHIFISPKDAEILGLVTDAEILLRSSSGEFRGRAFITDVAPGTLQGFWPEVNVLIPGGIVDAEGGVPDYNANVTVEVLREA